jgi:peptide deformylase
LFSAWKPINKTMVHIPALLCCGFGGKCLCFLQWLSECAGGRRKRVSSYFYSVGIFYSIRPFGRTEMAIRKIVQIEDPILKRQSRPVEKFDERLWQLLDDMKETLKKADGAGLAAVQVGVLRRVCVIDGKCQPGASSGEFIEVINPEIVKEDGVQEEEEGCLSLPGKQGITRRPAVVHMRAQDRYGKWHVHYGEGLKARAFCHEIDHMDGILFTERLADRK